MTRSYIGLYTKNYKILFKEIKDLYKRKDIPFSWFRTLNIVKMAISPNSSRDLMQSLLKSQQPLLQILTS